MRVIGLVALCMLSGITVACADEKPSLDEATQMRVDALAFLEQQRNAALNSLAMCQADMTRKLDRLEKENAALKKQLEEKK